VKKLLKVSRQVISDCSLKNGAIVAANSRKSYYPKNAVNYSYVWVRDASFACAAADVLGMKVQERFFDWCNDVERFPGTKLFRRRYEADGSVVRSSLRGEDEEQLQPDQTGTLLWALHHHFKENPERAKEYRDLICEAADGLCEIWKRDHFKAVTFDLWEERAAFPDLREKFTYTLAACAGGLRCASLLIPNRKWVKVAEAMSNVVRKTAGGFFFRSYGRFNDEELDASALGLVFPFKIIQPNDPKMVSTVNKIERKLVINGGVHRYLHDLYDGWSYKGEIVRRKGSGAWPILNFWMSIYFSRAGKPKSALKYYRWVLNRVGQHIPEQIFENRLQVSPSPLCWGHAMFVLANHELGYV